MLFCLFLVIIPTLAPFSFSLASHTPAVTQKQEKHPFPFTYLGQHMQSHSSLLLLLLCYHHLLFLLLIFNQTRLVCILLFPHLFRLLIQSARSNQRLSSRVSDAKTGGEQCHPVLAACMISFVLSSRLGTLAAYVQRHEGKERQHARLHADHVITMRTERNHSIPHLLPSWEGDVFLRAWVTPHSCSESACMLDVPPSADQMEMKRVITHTDMPSSSLSIPKHSYL